MRELKVSATTPAPIMRETDHPTEVRNFANSTAPMITMSVRPQPPQIA